MYSFPLIRRNLNSYFFKYSRFLYIYIYRSIFIRMIYNTKQRSNNFIVPFFDTERTRIVPNFLLFNVL